MLSAREAHGLETWIRAARQWGEAAQALVGRANDLAAASRELSELLHGPDASGDGTQRAALAAELQELATRIQEESSDLRERYLATAANLDLYRSVLE